MKLYRLLLKHTDIYPVSMLPEIDKGVILRHDIDFDIRPSLAVADLEYNMGIRSTYYIQLSSPYYNPLSNDNTKFIHRLLNQNHEIGLHYDPTVYNRGFSSERNILEILIDDDVKSVSLHNPSIHGKYPTFENIINTYDWDAFSDDNYFSDSCFKRQLDINKIEEKAQTGVVQLLLHPELYCVYDEYDLDHIDASIYDVTDDVIKNYSDKLLGDMGKYDAYKEHRRTN